MNELIEYLEKEIRQRILWEQKDIGTTDPLHYDYTNHLGALRAFHIVLVLIFEWKMRNKNNEK